MWDPDLMAWFNLTYGATDPRWWHGEAIWETAKKAGIRTGVCFWPGSEVPGKTPDYYLPYDKSLPYSSRVAKVVEWLSLPKKVRPRLLALYMEGVDTAGHAYGPGSLEVDAAIEECDVALGALVANITKLERTVGPATYVVVSDHGMAQVSPAERSIALEEDCNVVLSDNEVVETGPVLMANPADLQAVLSALENCSEHMQVYTQQTLPPRMHYTGNPRITKVVGVVESGWLVFRNRADAAAKSSVRGDHGYDPEALDMHGFLVAAGNGVHSDGRLLPRVPNVDIYEFLSRLLGIKAPAPTNTSGALATYALEAENDLN